MERKLVAAVFVVVVLTGCIGGPGDDSTPSDTGIEAENNSPNATGVQSVSIVVNGTVADDELTAVGATYPRDRFVVRAAQHENVSIGVDTDGDSEDERKFNETHISGVNNNAYSFDISLDTDYTLRSGDTITVEYPAIENPSEPGEYVVEVNLNDRQTANSTVVIE